MREKKINEETALNTLKLWQEEGRRVEVRLRYSQSIIQTHSGYVRIEPEGRVVIAQIIDKVDFFTTVLDIFAFDSIKLLESENAITFTEPIEMPETFWAVTVACLASPST